MLRYYYSVFGSRLDISGHVTSSVTWRIWFLIGHFLLMVLY